jgi:hypothetical protein
MSVTLLTAVGTARGPLETRNYTFQDGSPIQARWSAVALTEHLRHRTPAIDVARLIVISTPQGLKDNLDQLRVDPILAGVEVVAVEVDDGTSDAAFRALVSKVAAPIFNAEDIVLDLTQGPRHYSLLLLALTQLWRAMRNRPVLEAVYTPVLGPAAETPIVSMLPLMELDRLTQATRQFIDTGSPRALIDALPVAEDEHTRVLTDNLRRVSFARENALPIEAAIAAAQVSHNRKLIARVLAQRAPEGGRVAGLLLDAAAQLESPGIKGNTPKKEIVFDDAESTRQRRMVDHMVARDQWAGAAALGREWAVTHRVSGAEWLDKKARGRAERELGRWARLAHSKRATLPNEVRELGLAWDEWTEVRNALMHAGMRPQNVEKDFHARYDFPELWRKLQATTLAARGVSLNLEEPDLLVAPIGMSPGALYSAWRHSRAQDLLVVGSAQSLTRVDEALDAASADGRARPHAVAAIAVSDAVAGYDHGKQIRSDLDARVRGTPELADARALLDAALHAEVCITGGTSLLGWLADKIGAAADDRGAIVRHFAVSDARPLAAQRDEPWALGERHDL